VFPDPIDSRGFILPVASVSAIEAALTSKFNALGIVLDIAGDLNGDGVVNFGDLTPFVKALTNPSSYAAMFPGLDRVARCDISGDGNCNFGDLTPFVTRLTGGPASGAAIAVPEPASLASLLLAAVILALYFCHPTRMFMR
jgi:hypothetical protein